MEMIPLEKLPAQEFNVMLDNQNCKIKLYQRGLYMYMDLSVDNELVRAGMVCITNHSLLSYRTTKFKGYLVFIDTKDVFSTPKWRDLGSQYVLVYIGENGE